VNEIDATRSLPAPGARRRRFDRAWLRRNAGWLSFVAAPTLLAILYYGLIAADIYASEARYLVRSPSRAQIGGLGGLLQGGGLAPARDDVYTVHDYLLSRDALKSLAEIEDLRAVFARPGADFMARYPNPIDRDDFESFYRYYDRRVSVTIDSTTGITTLLVKAFTPDDAQRLAGHLLMLGEQLVNKLNERSRQNTVRDAERQVAEAEANIGAAEAALLGYRNRERLLDPGKSSSAVLDSQAKLQSELNSTRARLAQLDRSTPYSPLREDLKTHAEIIARQVEEQRAKLAGSEGSLAPRISEYGQLVLKQEFAGRALTSALASLESARAEARRQQIYLDRVVEPNLPDRALYPKRFEAVLIVFITCFLAYSIGALLLAGVREHEQT
jgi:capsular polysaccharide transport system permease protein